MAMLQAKGQRTFQEEYEVPPPQVSAPPQQSSLYQSAIKQNQFDHSMVNDQSRVISAPQPKKPLRLIQKTDSFCFYLFILFQLASFVISVFSLIKGNPDRLARPYDPDHRACGVDSGVEDFPFIYFVTPDDKFLYRTVCVKSCPQKGFSQDALECAVNSVVTSCKLNPQVSDLSNSVLLYNTIQYNQVCLPTTKYYYLELNSFLFPGVSQDAYRDIHLSLKSITLSIGISLLINIVFLFFIETRGRIVIWVILILFIITSFLGSLMSFQLYNQLKNPPQMPTEDTAQVDQAVLYPYTKSSTSFPLVFLALGILLTIVCVITISLSAFCGHRVILSVEMLKVAGDFIKANKLIMLLPLAFFFICWLYSLFWIYIALNLYSTYPISNQERQLPFDQVKSNIIIDILCALHLFVFFWNSAFFIGASEKLICGAVYDWNDRQGTDPKLPEINPLTASFRRITSLHIGSVVLGAFLIALTSFIRIIFEYIHQASKKIPILDRLCCCCNECYTNVLGRISKYNYVIVYLDGTGFWVSGQKVFELMQSQLPEVIQILELGGLGDIFTTIGRLFVSGIASLICYKMVASDPFMTMPYAPAFLCFVICFTISSVMMAIYGMSAEAIFMIYIYHKVEKAKQDDQPQCTKTLEIFIKQFNQSK